MTDNPTADQGVQDVEEPTQVQKTKIVVSGMTCGHCVASVTEELQGVDGVLEVAIPDLVACGDTDVFVESSGPLDLDAARAAVEEAGYTASV